MYSFLAVLCVVIVSSSADDDILVQIKNGKIQGTTTTNLDGELVYSFLGIPYGKAPINELRFKDPLPAEPWNETHDGTKYGNCCVQGGTGDSEDCLNLNVHTKELNATKLKPVMVFVHGGGFIGGCNTMYGPQFILVEDVVFVALNYRVGILGFLSLENATLGVPGNAALKDQALAMKWVQENIIHFGGDPNKVTILGTSAGAASVHYHVVSAASKGLFQQAVIQSGSVLNPWAKAKVNYHLAMKFAKFLKLEGRTEGEILEILRNYSASEFVAQQNAYFQGVYAAEVIGPVIEDPNDSQFLTEFGLDLLKSGRYNRVPMIIGYCSNEALLFETQKRDMIVTDPILKEQEFHMGMSRSLEMNLQMNHSNHSLSSRELIDMYFNGTNADNKYLLSSDYSFISGLIASSVIQANTSSAPIYLYKMTLDAGRNLIKRAYNLDNFTGVCHGDDLGYLFDFPGLPMGEEEEKYVRTFVKLWTNFAKYGNPTPNVADLGVEWKAVDENRHFIDIGKELTLRSKPESERMCLWQDNYFDVPAEDDDCARSSSSSLF